VVPRPTIRSIPAEILDSLRWRNIGPQGNRFSAVAGIPGNTRIYYAGSASGGVYKSTLGAATRKLMGLEKTGRIPRTIIHPRNPDIVLVCALGHSYGHQPERGVYRITDSGASWTQVFFVGPKTGCSDLAMDPSDPGVVFGPVPLDGAWSTGRRTTSATPRCSCGLMRRRL